MSNSIWHKPGHQPALGDKTKVSRDGGFIYWTAYGWNRPGKDVHDIGVEWAYVEDVLSQADKAERLQKAVDNSREKLAAFMHNVWGNWFAYQLNNSTVENLQRWGIQSNTPYSSLTETDKDKDRKFADQIIEIIKDEIKQLIKGE